MAYLRGFSCFCWIDHYITIKQTILLELPAIEGIWKRWTVSFKVGTSAPLSKFGASWKINWTGLLYIQRKAFGQSCRRHGITSVLKFSGNTVYWHYAREMRCCNHCKRWTYQILKLKVDKNSMNHFIWYLLCSEQPSACFLNIIKLNLVLEAKKSIFRSVRCSNNFGHHCIYVYIYIINKIK